MADTPDVTDAHSHSQHGHFSSTGNKKIDRLITYASFLISIVALFVSFHHSSILDRSASNQVRPFLTVDGGNNIEREKITFLEIRNSGLGPAKVEQFFTTYNGKKYDKFGELLEECCITDDRENLVAIFRPGGSELKVNNISPRVLEARSKVNYFELRFSPEIKTIWRKLDQARESGSLGAFACYCSMNDECWTTDFKTTTQIKVRNCH